MFELHSYPLNSTERLDNSTLTRFQEEDIVDVILEVVFGPSMLCIFVLLCLVSWIISLANHKSNSLRAQFIAKRQKAKEGFMISDFKNILLEHT